jgi:hypothetical protein
MKRTQLPETTDETNKSNADAASIAAEETNRCQDTGSSSTESCRNDDSRNNVNATMQVAK